MKKFLALIILLFVVIAIAFIISKQNKNNTDFKSNSVESNIIEDQNLDSNITQKDGYEIIVSKKDITLEKGKEESFEITFTNPDELSILEYITCEAQDDIIIVKYTPLENKKITVEVEALKAGEAEISICDYNYPDKKEIVNVKVIE